MLCNLLLVFLCCVCWNLIFWFQFASNLNYRKSKSWLLVFCRNPAHFTPWLKDFIFLRFDFKQICIEGKLIFKTTHTYHACHEHSLAKQCRVINSTVYSVETVHEHAYTCVVRIHLKVKTKAALVYRQLLPTIWLRRARVWTPFRNNTIF